jgi:hypothetical protein
VAAVPENIAHSKYDEKWNGNTSFKTVFRTRPFCPAKAVLSAYGWASSNHLVKPPRPNED